MNFPKLKYPGLCRIIPYVLVIGLTSIPTVLVFLFPCPDGIRIAAIFLSLILLLVFISKNFLILMGMDMLLATVSCHNTARTQYTFSEKRTADKIRRSICRYGIGCTPVEDSLPPVVLRYSFSSPLTVYSRGIERIVALYETPYLDADTYRRILSSGKANIKAVTGKKKALFLDKAQQKAPLNRVSVLVIIANSIDPQVAASLYDRICSVCGNEEEDCILPCVVDLSRRTCVFNSMRVPYVGFSYAVKNRGIRIIKDLVFGGNLNLKNNTALLPPIKDYDPEETLWDLWKFFRNEQANNSKSTNRRFDNMGEKEIRTDTDELYLKWDHRGICQSIKIDPEAMTVKIEDIGVWFYPKIRPIDKKTIAKIREFITDYYTKSGYTAEFVNIEELI